MFEILALLALVLLVLPLILSIRATSRVREMERRITRLERSAAGVPAERPAPAVPLPQGQPLTGAPRVSPASPPTALTESVPTLSSGALENLIGRKALGWIAVLLLFFAAAFFLKYAYENNWIGPMGQVSLVLFGGLLLAGAGRWCAGKNRRRFSIMLTAAGATVIYLATYSAFAYFEILPQQIAGIFLVIVLLELAAVALAYQSPVLATVAVMGGLATPILMTTEHDQYLQLFLYLTVLNLGVVLLLLWRDWPVIGTLSLLGTQALFWLWYATNYHPEKFTAALLFQLALLVVFRTEVWIGDMLRQRPVSAEKLVRLVLVAALSFGALYLLLEPDYRPWLGSLAIFMALTYAVEARLLLARRPQAQWQILTALAVTFGFVAVALPIQADATWVAVGWAAEGAALWWFGLRARSLPLRGLGAALGALAVARLLLVDTPTSREPFIPLLNRYGLPALGVTALVLGSSALGQRWRARLRPGEHGLARSAAIFGLLLLGWVLSVETYGYFQAWGRIDAADRQGWQWLGQMAISVLWALYASALLAVGFWRRQPELRWLAFGLYALTILKVLVFDMSRLQEFYRILAFFVLAVLLGLAAWAYQRRHLRLEHAFHWGNPR